MHLSYTRTPHVSPSAFLYAIVIFLFAIFPQEAEAKSYLIHISSSIVGLIVLAVDLVAIFEVLNSPRSVSGKIGWILAIFFFPVLGVLAYFFFGRRASTSGYEPIAA